MNQDSSLYISPLVRRMKMIFVSLFITATIAFLWLNPCSLFLS